MRKSMKKKQYAHKTIQNTQKTVNRMSEWNVK